MYIYIYIYIFIHICMYCFFCICGEWWRVLSCVCVCVYVCSCVFRRDSGRVKIADFGMARLFQHPLRSLVRVFTIWWAGVLRLRFIYRVKKMPKFPLSSRMSRGIFWHIWILDTNVRCTLSMRGMMCEKVMCVCSGWVLYAVYFRAGHVYYRCWCMLCVFSRARTLSLCI